MMSISECSCCSEAVSLSEPFLRRSSISEGKRKVSAPKRQAVPVRLTCVSTDVRRRAFADAMNRQYQALIQLRGNKFLEQYLSTKTVCLADELLALLAYFLTAFGSSVSCYCRDITIPVFEFEMRAVSMPDYFLFEFDKDEFLFHPNRINEPVNYNYKHFFFVCCILRLCATHK